MKKHTGNRFAKFVSLYIPIVMIINNVLRYNSQLSYKHSWKNLTTTHIVS